jgi:predicted Zn-dependent protease
LALRDAGKLDEAIECFKKAIEVKGDLAEAHNNLGVALREQGKPVEATASFNRAIEVDPDFAMAHDSLGIALGEQGKLAEAIACFRRASSLEPRMVNAHFNLGIALRDVGERDEAIACFERAIDLKPDYAEARGNLGLLLLEVDGRLAEGLRLLRLCHEAGSKRPGWPYPSAEWLKRGERLAELDARLPSILAGSAAPTGAQEALELADLCYTKQLFAAAARLSRRAFRDRPELAEDLRAGRRYNAACAAALAAGGRGKDAAGLAEPARAALRQEARAHVAADLKLWAARLEDGKAEAAAELRRTLEHWQRDPDLEGIRAREALQALPVRERAALAKLWEEVAALAEHARSLQGAAR